MEFRGRKYNLRFMFFPLFLLVFWGCEKGDSEEKEDEMFAVASEENIQNWQSRSVTASAYNSLEGQGSGNSAISAWGDTLKPGMKVIAVSRDLIEKGLTYGTPVKIEGLEGVFIVRDKMNSRWKNKIDIYMGTNREKALQWGRKKVEICFPKTKNEAEKIK